MGIWYSGHSENPQAEGLANELDKLIVEKEKLELKLEIVFEKLKENMHPVDFFQFVQQLPEIMKTWQKQ